MFREQRFKNIDVNRRDDLEQMLVFRQSVQERWGVL
jgi:hypothetical protein